MEKKRCKQLRFRSISIYGFLLLFLLLSLSVFLGGCTTAKIKETPASVQAREQAANIEKFVLQEVEPANIEARTKEKIKIQFSDCSASLRECANEIMQVQAKLNQTEKKVLKNKTVKARLIATVVILSLVIVGYGIIRILILVYLRR